MFANRFAADNKIANRFAANNRVANRFAAVLTTKTSEVSPLQSKMKQVSWPKVKVSLPKSYHSADASNTKYLVFKGVSNNISVNEFKELLHFNKITDAEAEHMKSKRSGKELPSIKIKSDDPKQVETLISGGLLCQKTGLIFGVEEFKTRPLIVQCFKCQGTKLYQKRKMCCVW